MFFPLKLNTVVLVIEHYTFCQVNIFCDRNHLEIKFIKK